MVNKTRVTKLIKDNIWIEINNEDVKANAKGNIRLLDSKIYVGDIVDYEIVDGIPLITNINDRRVVLDRPRIANIDTMVIVQSTISPDFDPYLLDQMICFYEQYEIDVVIALSKTDINFSNQIKQWIDDYEKMGYKIFDLNDQKTFEQMLLSFKNKLVCFAGNSGVGKSTLINRICPELNLRTQEISKVLNRGKHTTTSTQIIKVKDYYLADSPGYSTINLNLTKEQFAHIFFHRILQNKYCKFNDCLHTSNTLGCEIKNLLNSGNLVKWRYDNYIKIMEGLKKKYD